MRGNWLAIWSCADKNRWTWRGDLKRASRRMREFLPEFQAPLPDRLMRHRDAAGSQHLLHHAQAQWEPEIEPYRVANDLSGVAMAGVDRISCARHSPHLLDQ